MSRRRRPGAGADVPGARYLILTRPKANTGRRSSTPDAPASRLLRAGGSRGTGRVLVTTRSGDDRLRDRLPMTGPYTRKPMEAASGATDARDSRFEGLRAEASAAVGYSANTIRGVREQYRTAYAEALSRWQDLRDELDGIHRTPPLAPVAAIPARPADPDRPVDPSVDRPRDDQRRSLRGEVESLAKELEEHRSALARLELAERTLSRTWLFLERGDSSLVAPGSEPGAGEDVAMRIVEAQEAERARLAQDIHDGPIQALSNAIFQADYAERMSVADPAVPRRDRVAPRSAPPGARQPARLHQPAPPAGTRRARARRRDRGGGRPSARDECPARHHGPARTGRCAG